ncbi:MAG: hypothetical protein AAB731_04530 [Patescibacteria group bacterium]|mgnify:CR=1
MSNTKRGGLVRFFIFKEGKKYIGLCLDLDIVEENVSLEALKASLSEAAVGYVETVINGDMSDRLLNKAIPKSYLRKYQAYLRCLERETFNKQSCPTFNGALISTASLPLHRNWTML